VPPKIGTCLWPALWAEVAAQALSTYHAVPTLSTIDCVSDRARTVLFRIMPRAAIMPGLFGIINPDCFENEQLSQPAVDGINVLIIFDPKGKRTRYNMCSFMVSPKKGGLDVSTDRSSLLPCVRCCLRAKVFDSLSTLKT
jgi:hypothetical protein